MGVEFFPINRCPGCSHESRTKLIDFGAIPRYHFGKVRVTFPKLPLVLYRCDRCGIGYKNLLPTKASLTALFRGTCDVAWTSKSNAFARDVALLKDKRLLCGTSILDIGANDGAFLRTVKAQFRSCASVEVCPRRQLLDVTEGHNYAGLIEDERVDLGMQFDVITAFDVLEHVYAPGRAAENIKALVSSDGHCVAITGDLDRLLRGRLTYYFLFVEHHCFWNFQSFKFYFGHRAIADYSLICHREVEALDLSRRFLYTLKHYSIDMATPQIIGKLSASRRLRSAPLPGYADHAFVVVRKPS